MQWEGVYPIFDIGSRGFGLYCAILGGTNAELNSMTRELELNAKLWLHPISGGCRSSEQSALARRLLQGICIDEGIEIANIDLTTPGLELIDIFSNHLGIYLSISHCSSLLAVALSHDLIGVDCEAIGRRRNWDGIANSFFTEFEAKAIIAADERMKEPTFLRHWVLKEAYIKANRGSIFGDLNRLVLVNTHSARIEDDGGHGEWHGWLLKEGNCFVALCGLQAEFLLAYRVDQLPLRIDEGISRGSKVFSFEQVRIGRQLSQ